MPQANRLRQADPVEVEPPLGAWPADAGIRFRVYATGVERISVRIVDRAGQTLKDEIMTPVGSGDHEAVVADAVPGTLYKYVLDGKELPDPFARFLPFGVEGPAMVVADSYRWQHGLGVCRALREHVIYELHVGTFTSQGSYLAAGDRLGDLVDLGVTAVELMPIGAFPGNRGWGYDGVAHFAPFAPYGTPDDLRAFVDRAHGLGLAVFLDVVYNHFGPAGNHLKAFSPDYFSRDIKNAWGDAPNFQKPAMRRYVLQNAQSWLRDFRFDGLRLDATHAIVDPSPRHILQDLADAVKAIAPAKLLIAEDERNEPALVAQQGLHAVWADDFHHAARVALTAENEGYYAAFPPGVDTLARTIRQGWFYQGQTYPPSGRCRGRACPELTAESLVYCIQNHDQIGNRALGDRLSNVVDADAYAVVSTLLLFLPMTPLLFMGQEWAASSPFQYFTDHDPDLGKLVSQGRREEFKAFSLFAAPERRDEIPDPQAEATFTRSKLDWDERGRPPHARILRLYQDLLRLRRVDPVLRETGREGLDARSVGNVLLVRRWDAAGGRLLIANFGQEPVRLETLGNLRRREVIFDSGPPGRNRSAPDALAGHTALILA